MKNFLWLITGVAIGAITTHIYLTDKYNQQINEDFRKNRAYKPKEKNKEEVKVNKNSMYGETKDNIHKKSMGTVKSIIRENNYTSNDEPEIHEPTRRPEILKPEDFATLYGFDTDTLVFREGQIYNDRDDLVENVDELLGLSVEDIQSQFGVHEDFAVYIRNYQHSCDYEILLEEPDIIEED